MMTNADKVRNSKNVWRVIKPGQCSIATYYKSTSDGFYYCTCNSVNNAKWSFTTDFCLNWAIIEEIVPVPEKIMTNADKVRNSKNVWKVVKNSEISTALYYKSINNMLYFTPYVISNARWFHTHDLYINDSIIEEIVSVSEKILSPIEQIIANPEVVYQIEHNTCKQIRNVKWENHRLMIDCYNTSWQEILVGNFENDFNHSTFKKYEDLETRLKNVKLPVGYELQKQHDMFRLVGPSMDRDLNKQIYSSKVCQENIEFWSVMKSLYEEMEKEK